MAIPSHTSDPARLAALATYAILDTPAEQGFDDIVQLASQICEVPVALVSLVDANRQWFKARIGFEPCETALSSSVCAHALTEPDLLVIADLTQDERTKANPLVTGPPYIRFYAGAPFRTASGEALGSLCVIDGAIRPGGLTGAQASGLRNLARQVMSQMELRRAIAERDALVAEQHRADHRRNALLLLGDQLRDMTAVADMTRAAASIVGQVLDVSRAGFGRFEENGEHLTVEPDWTADGVKSIAGRHRLDDYGDLRAGLARGEALIISDVALDPRTAATAEAVTALGVRSFVNMPLRQHGRTIAVFIVHDRHPRLWAPEVLTFLRNVVDRLEVGIARIEAEAQQHVLNNELSHRLKNTFAMIQAIAVQTLRTVPDQKPIDIFIKRLHALSNAHDVLLQQMWRSAKIEEVVKAAVETLSDAMRFDISGPQLDLGPRATLSLSLLLHELTTNAMKYGALSCDMGRVAVAWRLDNHEDDVQMVLDWREIGGPIVKPPDRNGFGSKLIRMGLTGTGAVELRYLASGLQAEFKAPLAQVQEL